MAAPQKEVHKRIKLEIQAGAANPSPPVGPALGQAGLNIMEFCKAFNDKTKEFAGQKLPVKIVAYKDKTFDFKVSKPSMSSLIKKEMGIESGSKTPGLTSAGKLKKSQAKKIAEFKLPDLNTTNIEAAARIVEGQARSMGIEVVEG
jgi:large subunit ribosomal protein L11